MNTRFGNNLLVEYTSMGKYLKRSLDYDTTKNDLSKVDKSLAVFPFILHQP